MPNLKIYLKKHFTAKELELFRKSFDIVGDIALLEIPRELSKKQKIIANAVLDMHTNIKAVYKELGGRKGKLRLQKLMWLAGEKRTETVCKENTIQLKLDVAKVYFSPRMATERKRIYNQIKNSEKVLVMFSGAGPYVIEIAKLTKAAVVYGIEINKTAHRYSEQNAVLNKVEGKTKLFSGDVKKLVPRLKIKFDRIIMPLPKGASNYLGLALNYVKKGGVINYYDFLSSEDIPGTAISRVMDTANDLGKKARVIKVVKCGQLAPRMFRVCVDFKVL